MLFFALFLKRKNLKLVVDCSGKESGKKSEVDPIVKTIFDQK